MVRYLIVKDTSLDNWGGVAAMALLFYGLLGLGIDWVLLKFFNYWVTQGIGIIILGVILLIDLLQ